MGRSRHPHERLTRAKATFVRRVNQSKRNRGRHRKRYKDTIQVNLLAEIAANDLESTAKEKAIWRAGLRRALEGADTGYIDMMNMRPNGSRHQFGVPVPEM